MKYSATFLIRRHPWAFGAAVVASLMAIALAVGPPPWRRYDRSIAVLTATLVAVIWYTFLTYCAIHREERSRLTVEPLISSNKQLLVLHIANVTRERTIDFRMEWQAWNDGGATEIGESLRPGNDHWISLRPAETVDQMLTIPSMRGKPGSKFGPRVDTIDRPELAFIFELHWRDDLSDRGRYPAERWLLDRSAMKLTRVKTDSDLAKWREVVSALAAG